MKTCNYCFSILIPVSLLISGLFLTSCNKREHPEEEKTFPRTFIDEHTSRNSLDWDGKYKGILPCADCDGIETVLSLSRDHSYEMSLRYLGKSDSLYMSSGSFYWNDAGNTITLINQLPPNQYFVGENVLIKLDIDGNKMENSRLKISDSDLFPL